MADYEVRLKNMERAIQDTVEDIERNHLRKMQGAMHKCAANCCDDESQSVERTRYCIENCTVPVQNAQQFVQTEIDRLQNRWSRCVMDCNDKIRDSMTPGQPTDRLTKEFGNCANVCIDAQFNVIKTIKANIDRALTSGKYNAQV